jgi:hypothetical protein
LTLIDYSNELSPDMCEPFRSRDHGLVSKSQHPSIRSRLAHPCACSERWAAPVAGDSGEIAKIRPVLAQTRLEAEPLQLAYDANRDGWAAKNFHAKGKARPGRMMTCPLCLHRRVDSPSLSGLRPCCVASEKGCWDC